MTQVRGSSSQGGSNLAALDLPAALAPIPAMHEVFHIMSTIANDAETHAAYQRHLDAQRVEAEWQHDREEAHRAKDEAIAALEAGLRALEEERRAKEEERRAREEAVRAQEEAQARAEALARELAELRRRFEEA